MPDPSGVTPDRDENDESDARFIVAPDEENVPGVWDTSDPTGPELCLTRDEVIWAVGPVSTGEALWEALTARLRKADWCKALGCEDFTSAGAERCDKHDAPVATLTEYRVSLPPTAWVRILAPTYEAAREKAVAVYGITFGDLYSPPFTDWHPGFDAEPKATFEVTS